MVCGDRGGGREDLTTIAELVIEEARARGNRYIFGIPGGGSGLSLIAAAHKAGLHFVLVNNEATAAMAAAAYGQMNGAPGICFSIQGSGGGNLAGGISVCYLERGPVLAITDRYPDDLLGHVALQDAHLAQVFAPITKATSTLRPQTARVELARAFEVAWAERPGPVHLDLPLDLVDVAVGDGSSLPSAASPAGLEGVETAIAKLRAARRVAVVVGTDALRAGAQDEVRCLVEQLEAVVLSCFRARGLFPENHPRFGTTMYGSFAADTCEMDFLTEADLVVLAGVDPIELHRPWPHALPVLQVQLGRELDEPCPAATTKVFGPIRSALRALAEGSGSLPGFAEEEIRRIRQRDFDRCEAPDPNQLSALTAFLRARTLLPRQGILVQETGIYDVLNEHFWPVYGPGTYVGVGGSRTMGSAVPWAIGVALARPGTPVLACSGDGGFLMRLQELEVVARMGLRVVFLVFNDGQLGTIQARATARKLAVHGLQFAPVDFVAVARAFGLRGAVVSTLGELETAVKEGLAADRSSVIDIKLDPSSYTAVFPRLVGGASRQKA